MSDAPHHIVFGPVDEGEVVKSSDKLIVDPKLFKGQFQPDGNLCNYLALAAQIHTCNPDQSQAEISKKVIENAGILKVAEMVRTQVGTPRLSNFQAQDEFRERAGIEPVYGATGLKQAGIWKEGDNVGRAMASAIANEGMLPSILLMSEDHVVLGIGTSDDKKEIIAWDALTGQGNPRLRRISVDKDNMGMIIAAKVNPVFKQ